MWFPYPAWCRWNLLWPADSEFHYRLIMNEGSNKKISYIITTCRFNWHKRISQTVSSGGWFIQTPSGVGVFLCVRVKQSSINMEQNTYSGMPTNVSCQYALMRVCTPCRILLTEDSSLEQRFSKCEAHLPGGTLESFRGGAASENPWFRAYRGSKNFPECVSKKN